MTLRGGGWGWGGGGYLGRGLRSLDGGIPGGRAFEDDVIAGEDHELFWGFLCQLGGLQDWGEGMGKGGGRWGSGGDTGLPTDGPIGRMGAAPPDPWTHRAQTQLMDHVGPSGPHRTLGKPLRAPTTLPPFSPPSGRHEDSHKPHRPHRDPRETPWEPWGVP